RPVLPPRLAVPQINTLDHAPVAWKVNRAGRAARRNPVTNRELLNLTVTKANDNALKEDFTTAHAQLNCPESSIVMPHVDRVVILPSIHMGLAQIIPTAVLRVSGRAENQSQKQPHRDHHMLLHSVFSYTTY